MWSICCRCLRVENNATFVEICREGFLNAVKESFQFFWPSVLSKLVLREPFIISEQYVFAPKAPLGTFYVYKCSTVWKNTLFTNLFRQSAFYNHEKYGHHFLVLVQFLCQEVWRAFTAVFLLRRWCRTLYAVESVCPVNLSQKGEGKANTFVSISVYLFPLWVMLF